MFGNLLRECGVLNSLSESARRDNNIVTILLSITVPLKCRAGISCAPRHC
ncbi:MAG: hypothetical protein ACLUFV_12205 [Acutalibacteraceae bacterium]